MKIQKRNGSFEELSFDKVLRRLQNICNDPKLGVLKTPDIAEVVSKKVIAGIYDGVKSSDLDEVSAQIANELSTLNLEYDSVASRVIISNMHKSTLDSFSGVMKLLYSNRDINGDPAPLVSKGLIDFVEQNTEVLDKSIDYLRDYKFDYFGYKTLEKSYLMKMRISQLHNDKESQVSLEAKPLTLLKAEPKELSQENSRGAFASLSKRASEGHGEPVMKVVERPQHMYMRVAIGIHGASDSYSAGALEKVLETYDYLSQGLFTHATPTLFNAGTPHPQCSSCFLHTLNDDSIDGIFKSVADCAKISKWAGGIGISIHSLRASGSIIRGTNGRSDGVVPMLRVFNEVAKYVNQGGKRNGSIAVYLELWHADILNFLEMRRHGGDENSKARDLFYALWVPDLFMKCVEENGDWYLMCPNQSPQLYDTYGREFESLYNWYIREHRFVRKIKARDLLKKIVESQIETGTPYMLYKDSCNEKSNQKNLGTIRSSNLCAEILEYSSPTETAVCNLSSLALPRFVASGVFDHQLLHKITKLVVRNLNKIIDLNFYPIPETQLSNLRHRPVGIGVQGLADVYMLLKLPFDSAEAFQLNKEIFETIYHGALESSMELARERTELSDPLCSGTIELNLSSEARALAIEDQKGTTETGAYSSFAGSPLSQGLFQFDLWGKTPESEIAGSPAFGRWNWKELRERVVKNGVRNSLLVALMPTASTAQILGNNESIEPYTSNLYKRTVLSGEFIVKNKYLIRDLQALGLWNEHMKNTIISNEGSVQNIPTIPQSVRELYKTAEEINPEVLLQASADRAIYVDQTQSLNIFIKRPTINSMGKLHLLAWKLGLKTGMYYLRSKPSRQAVKITVDPNIGRTPVDPKPSLLSAPVGSKTNVFEQLPVSSKTTDVLSLTENSRINKTMGSLAETKEIDIDTAEGAVCTMKEGCISCGS